MSAKYTPEHKFYERLYASGYTEYHRSNRALYRALWNLAYRILVWAFLGAGILGIYLLAR